MADKADCASNEESHGVTFAALVCSGSAGNVAGIDFTVGHSRLAVKRRRAGTAWRPIETRSFPAQRHADRHWERVFEPFNEMLSVWTGRDAAEKSTIVACPLSVC